MQNKSNQIDLSLLNSLKNIGDKLFIACSGGLDSVVLLDYCYRLFGADRLVIIHFNHRWSEYSNEYVKIIYKLGKKYNIPVVVGQADSVGVMSETASRDARYQFFQQAASQYNISYILTAHHLDDQIETVMMQLFRGTAAMMGMSNTQDRKNITVCRPLLYYDRKWLENYQKTYQLNYIEDPTNADIAIPRNYLRHEILPRIASLYPQYVDAIGRFLSVRALEHTYFEKVIEGLYIDERLYQRDFWRQLDRIIAYKLLRKILTEQKINSIDQIMISNLYELLIKKPVNRVQFFDLDANYQVKIEYYSFIIQRRSN